jgi:hypothetical protein
MSIRSEYDRFLKSIGPYSFDAIIRAVAEVHYGFVLWLRGPDTRVIWKARILRHMQRTCALASSSPAPCTALAQQLHHMEMATLQTCCEMADAMVAAGIHDLDCLKDSASSREALRFRLRCVYSFSGLQIRKIKFALQGATKVTHFMFSWQFPSSHIATGSCVGLKTRLSCSSVIGSASRSYREQIIFLFHAISILPYIIFNRLLQSTSSRFHRQCLLTLRTTNRMKMIEILTLFTMQTRFLANARDRLMQSIQPCVM